jgi:xanthine dehydrogenase accessory factor
LKSVVGLGARYLGLIGSRRKKTVIFGALESEDGVPKEALARVHCPIGLPIGGETPEEIAVSIVAELLQVKHAK